MATSSAYVTSFPAVSKSEIWTDRVITQGHVNYCAENGHATYTVNGADQEMCPRCGVFIYADAEAQPEETPSKTITISRNTFEAIAATLTKAIEDEEKSTANRVNGDAYSRGIDSGIVIGLRLAVGAIESDLIK